MWNRVIKKISEYVRRFLPAAAKNEVSYNKFLVKLFKAVDADDGALLVKACNEALDSGLAPGVLFVEPCFSWIPENETEELDVNLWSALTTKRKLNCLMACAKEGWLDKRSLAMIGSGNEWQAQSVSSAILSQSDKNEEVLCKKMLAANQKDLTKLKKCLFGQRSASTWLFECYVSAAGSEIYPLEFDSEKMCTYTCHQPTDKNIRLLLECGWLKNEDVMVFSTMLVNSKMSVDIINECEAQVLKNSVIAASGIVATSARRGSVL